MRICFLTCSVHSTRGGSTKYFFEITKAIKEQGHYVAVVCTDSVSSKNIGADELIFLKELKLPLVGDHLPILRFLLQTLLFGLLSFLKVRKKDFDIYCYESGYMGLWAILFKFIKRKPVVSFPMRYSWNFLKLNFSSAYKVLRPVYILWELAFFINEMSDTLLADRVITLTNEGKEVLIRSGIIPQKITVIPYGVDLEKYRPTVREKELAIELKLDDNDKLILFVGHLDPSRNTDKLISAFSLLLKRQRYANINSNLKLIIVGSGPVEVPLKELTNTLGLQEYVQFMGHISDEVKLMKIYNLATLLVLPQVAGTNSILGVACGIPVVTRRNTVGLLTSVSEDIVDNFTLFDSDSPEEIANTCYKVLQNPTTLKNISLRGLGIIREYSWQNIATKIVETMLLETRTRHIIR